MSKRRSRRWELVKQDVLRLAALGLSVQEIADRVEVDRATVFRWKKDGKLSQDGVKPDEVTAKRTEIAQKANGQSPAEWSASVRATYDLDATDSQLVTMAESTLLKAHDPSLSTSLRLQAMRTFQGLVKQLNLVARAAPAAQPPVEEPKKKLLVVRRTGADPRLLVMAK
jgi:transposase-like protein